jgi:hypothetical protein
VRRCIKGDDRQKRQTADHSSGGLGAAPNNIIATWCSTERWPAKPAAMDADPKLPPEESITIARKFCPCLIAFGKIDQRRLPSPNDKR